ncbi:Zinc finger, CCHC-type [Dillenia turbinata]|uniref:Zinc finger, CCHC-type n=1 Tax=Dillenia turbinata TaxID=194707 RepID=A0AAN8UV60_9MAGN
MDAVEDEEFFSQLAAAEAQAISQTHKRRKISTNPNSSSSIEKVAEGSYTAALKGSNSLLFSQIAAINTTTTTKSFNKAFTSQSQPVDLSGGGDSCFKCGKSGHWARDCDSRISDPSTVDVESKPCRCGNGLCLILTSNTPKNPGRKFFKCPLREENGGCGFFEWCDNNFGTIGSSVTESERTRNYAMNCSSYPDLPCPCGAGSCLILTAKTAKNYGQQFYRCPANQESSCGFFKWCNDNAPATPLPVSTSRVSTTINGAGNKNYGLKSGSSCFKCGNEGHWAKDCSMQSLDSHTGRPALSNTCYKRGQSGHWARDCQTSEDTKARCGR